MPFLRSVALKRSLDDAPLAFSFSVPVVHALSELRFPTAVTFFVGENGSESRPCQSQLALLSMLKQMSSEDS